MPILFDLKVVENLAEAHVKQVLDCLAASELRLGLVVNSCQIRAIRVQPCRAG